MALSTICGTIFVIYFVIAEVHSIGVDPSLEVDFLHGVYMNALSSSDVTQVPGYPHSSGAAFNFEGTTRTIEASEQSYQKLKNLLSGTAEFTFVANINQGKRNSGSIVSITVNRIRYLDIFTSTRNGEFRFYYTHDGQVQMESIPYPFKANHWHQLAVTVSGPHLKLIVDCEEVGSRRIRAPDLDFSKPGLTIYVGQRGDRTYYKGILQDVKLIASSQGYIAQCPNMGRTCPTCGEYQAMVETITRLENKLHRLQSQLGVAEARIDELENCHCQRDCLVNGEIYSDEQTWEDSCLTCTCSEGHVTCSPMECPEVYCKNPVYESGSCCPTCRANCTVSGVTYHHGEQYQQKIVRGALQICNVKQCNNGGASTISTDMVNNMCPTPNCDASQRFTVVGSCCQYCQGTDYCAQGHDCEAPKVCVNMQTTYQCLCPTGYIEENGNCTDINECIVSEAQPDHHCYDGTVCVNSPGGYSCQCLDGYERVTDTTCRQIDECAEGGHNCDEHATCTDTDGSFTCVCRNRYHGDGTYCFPICNKECVNGGICIQPNVCECPPGYEGDACELDIDECTAGTDLCTGNSHCVNLPGSYHCDCDWGYERPAGEIDYGTSCADINECNSGNTCDKSRLCVNTEGSYQCRCSAANDCSSSCRTDQGKKSSGSTWDTNLCQTCTCRIGVVTCTRKVCDCSEPDIDPVCCPMCALEVQQCLHQTSAVTYNHREWWQHECQDCQCLEGKIKCKAVQCTPPNCVDTYTPVGECCPRCQPHNQCDLTSMASDPGAMTEGATCQSGGKIAAHNQRWYLYDDHCTECICKNGNICCWYNSACNQ